MSKNNRDDIGYASLLHLAMLGVVKQVLFKVSKTGLPSKHSLYISFLSSKEVMLKYHEELSIDPDESGIIVGEDLIKKYGDEITIVIEHQYKNLQVDDFGFSIQLSFNSSYQNLYIPYTYITKFIDPSVNFRLDFLPNRNLQKELSKDQNIKKEPIGKSKTKKSKVVSNSNIEDFIIPTNANKELRLVTKKNQTSSTQQKGNKVISFKQFSKKIDKEDS